MLLLNIRKQYKNNKLKIITPTWNDKSELPDGSYSVLDNQDYIEYIIIWQHKKLIDKTKNGENVPSLEVVRVVSNYSSLEYSSNYSETTRSLWFYSKDEATDFKADIENTNNFKSFMYKAKLLKDTEADNANRVLKV